MGSGRAWASLMGLLYGRDYFKRHIVFDYTWIQTCQSFEALFQKIKASVMNDEAQILTERRCRNAAAWRIHHENEINRIQQMRNDFEELQAAFAVYLDIAGRLVIAIMIETMPALLAALCRLWYYLSQTTFRAGAYVDSLADNVILLFLLLVIIETGDYMKIEVNTSLQYRFFNFIEILFGILH